MKKQLSLLWRGRIFLLSFLAVLCGSVNAQEFFTDVLTATSLDLSSGNYSRFEGKTGFPSGVVYAGNAATGTTKDADTEETSTTIRLSNQPVASGSTGIITTSSDKIIKSIKVKWSGSTAGTRTLSVYLRNKEYSLTEATNKEISGDKTVSFEYTKSDNSSYEKTIEISDEYKYVAFVNTTNGSSNSAIYLDKIEIVWENRILTPILTSSNGGNVFTGKTVITATSEDGAIIYYTTNGEDPTEDSNVFPKDGLHITETTTIKAMAVKDGVKSAIAEETFTERELRPDEILRAMVFDYKGKYFAATNTLNSGRLDVVDVGCVNGKVISEGTNIGWYIDEEKFIIKASNGQYLADDEIDVTNATNVKFQDSPYYWKGGSKDWYIISPVDGAERSLLYYNPYGVKAYATSNLTNSSYSAMQIATFADGYVREVGASEAPKYGTICLPYAVAEGDFSGAEFCSVLGKITTGDEVTALALSEPVKELEAGKPYIFYATADKVVLAYSGEETETAATDNGLIGSFEGRDVPEGKHVISGNKVQRCGTGSSIAEHRAYIDFEKMAEYQPVQGVNARLLTFDGVTTSVGNIQAEAGRTADVYTLSGVLVRKQADLQQATEGLPKGVYIVGGKKMIVE